MRTKKEPSNQSSLEGSFFGELLSDGNEVRSLAFCLSDVQVLLNEVEALQRVGEVRASDDDLRAVLTFQRSDVGSSGSFVLPLSFYSLALGGFQHDASEEGGFPNREGGGLSLNSHCFLLEVFGFSLLSKNNQQLPAMSNIFL